jgi:hypothetical protein
LCQITLFLILKNPHPSVWTRVNVLSEIITDHIHEPLEDGILGSSIQKFTQIGRGVDEQSFGVRN